MGIKGRQVQDDRAKRGGQQVPFQPLTDPSYEEKIMSRVQNQLEQNVKDKIHEMFMSERVTICTMSLFFIYQCWQTQTKASDDLSNFVRAHTPAILRADSLFQQSHDLNGMLCRARFRENPDVVQDDFGISDSQEKGNQDKRLCSQDVISLTFSGQN